MRYWIHKAAVLKKWKDRALVAVNMSNETVNLSKAERMFLMTCDGREQQPHPSAAFLINSGIVTCNAEEGTTPYIDVNPVLCRNTAVIAVTGRCNYHCRHCIAADGLDKSEDELSIDTLCSLFDQMTALGICRVWLTGGEPLLHPHFAQIVREISKRGMKLERILTNGSLLTQSILELLKQCDQRPIFGISFDGIGTHDWMRCHAGAERISLAAIDLAVQNGFTVMAHVNVNRVTAPVIIDTCRTLVKVHGCQMLRLIPTSHSPRWQATTGQTDTISYDSYFALMLELIRTAHNEKWNANLDLRSLPQQNELGMLKKPQPVNPNAFLMHWCPRTKNQIFIAHDGRVLPCNAYEGNSKQYGFLCGEDINIYKRTLVEILTASELVDICTQKVENHLSDVEKCRSCKWAGICCGGCPLYAFGNRMKLIDENPNCAFYSGGWAEKYIALLEELE